MMQTPPPPRSSPTVTQKPLTTKSSSSSPIAQSSNRTQSTPIPAVRSSTPNSSPNITAATSTKSQQKAPSPSVPPSTSAQTSQQHINSKPPSSAVESKFTLANIAYGGFQLFSVGCRIYQYRDLLVTHPFKGIMIAVSPTISHVAPLLVSDISQPIPRKCIETAFSLPGEYVSFSEDFIGYGIRKGLEILFAKVTNTNSYLSLGSSTIVTFLSLFSSYIFDATLQSLSVIGDNQRQIVSTRDLSNYALSFITKKIIAINHTFDPSIPIIKLGYDSSPPPGDDDPSDPPENHFLESLIELSNNCWRYARNYKKNENAYDSLDEHERNNTPVLLKLNNPTIYDRVKKALSLEELLLRCYFRKLLDTQDIKKSQLAMTSLLHVETRNKLYEQLIDNQKKFILTILECIVIKTMQNNTNLTDFKDNYKEVIKHNTDFIYKACLANPDNAYTTALEMLDSKNEEISEFLSFLKIQLQEYHNLVIEYNHYSTPEIKKIIKDMQAAERNIFFNIKNMNFTNCGTMLTNNFGFMGFIAGTLICGLVKGEMLYKVYNTYIKILITDLTAGVSASQISLTVEFGSIKEKHLELSEELEKILNKYSNELKTVIELFILNQNNDNAGDLLKQKFANINRDIQLIKESYSHLNIDLIKMNECIEISKRVTHLFLLTLSNLTNANRSWLLEKRNNFFSRVPLPTTDMINNQLKEVSGLRLIAL